MSMYKLSLVAGGLAVVLAACASATPEPTSEPAAVPPAAEEEAPPTTDVEAPPATEEEAMEEIIPSVTVSDQVAANGNISVAQVSAGEEVKVIDINFQAKVVTVPVGTTVTWVYDGALPHTVTSDTNVFNSGTMGEGDVFTFTFTEEGSFPYFCMFHGGKGGSGMSGVVNVTEG